MTKFSFTTRPETFTVNGMRATLHRSNFNSTLNPIPEVQVIQDGTCSFSGDPLDNTYISISSNAGLVFRSANLGSTIQTDNAFLIQKADPITFTSAQLAGMLPALPITNADTTITTLSLALRNGFIRATGTGSKVVFLGSMGFSYVYDFAIDPVTNVSRINELVEVRTIAMTVTGSNGGLLGGIANLIIGAVNLLLNSMLANQFRTAIQTAVTNAVNNAISAETPPKGTTITAETVIITTAAMTIQAFGGISFEDLCSSNATFGSIKLRPIGQVNQLRAIRNELLSNNAYGKKYVDLFYKNNRELMRLLIKSPELLKKADKAVAGALKDFKQQEIAKGILSKATADAVLNAFEIIKKLGCSNELLHTLVALEPDVKALTNKNISDLLQKSSKGF
jgi:hypothetical protein